MHRVGGFAYACFVRVLAVVKTFAPVRCAVEIAVGKTFLDTIFVSHLYDVNLAAFRPYYAPLCSQLLALTVDRIVIAEVGCKVIAEHPERRP